MVRLVLSCHDDRDRRVRGPPFRHGISIGRFSIWTPLSSLIWFFPSAYLKLHFCTTRFWCSLLPFVYVMCIDHQYYEDVQQVLYLLLWDLLLTNMATLLCRGYAAFCWSVFQIPDPVDFAYVATAPCFLIGLSSCIQRYFNLHPFVPPPGNQTQFPIDSTYFFV